MGVVEAEEGAPVRLVLNVDTTEEFKRQLDQRDQEIRRIQYERSLLANQLSVSGAERSALRSQLLTMQQQEQHRLQQQMQVIAAALQRQEAAAREAAESEAKEAAASAAYETTATRENLAARRAATLASAKHHAASDRTGGLKRPERQGSADSNGGAAGEAEAEYRRTVLQPLGAGKPPRSPKGLKVRHWRDEEDEDEEAALRRGGDDDDDESSTQQQGQDEGSMHRSGPSFASHLRPLMEDDEGDEDEDGMTETERAPIVGMGSMTVLPSGPLSDSAMSEQSNVTAGGTWQGMELSPDEHESLINARTPSFSFAFAPKSPATAAAVAAAASSAASANTIATAAVVLEKQAQDVVAADSRRQQRRPAAEAEESGRHGGREVVSAGTSPKTAAKFGRSVTLPIISIAPPVSHAAASPPLSPRAVMPPPIYVPPGPALGSAQSLQRSVSSGFADTHHWPDRLVNAGGGLSSLGGVTLPRRITTHGTPPVSMPTSPRTAVGPNRESFNDLQAAGAGTRHGGNRVSFTPLMSPRQPAGSLGFDLQHFGEGSSGAGAGRSDSAGWVPGSPTTAATLLAGGGVGERHHFTTTHYRSPSTSMGGASPGAPGGSTGGLAPAYPTTHYGLSVMSSAANSYGPSPRMSPRPSRRTSMSCGPEALSIAGLSDTLAMVQALDAITGDRLHASDVDAELAALQLESSKGDLELGAISARRCDELQCELDRLRGHMEHERIQREAAEARVAALSAELKACRRSMNQLHSQLQDVASTAQTAGRADDHSAVGGSAPDGMLPPPVTAAAALMA